MPVMTVKNFIYGGVALLLLFVIASTLILPFFSTTYEVGFGDLPCNSPNHATGCVGLTNTSTDITNSACLTSSGDADITACADCNSSTGYETFLTSCYRLFEHNSTDVTMNGTHCIGCTTLQGYRTTNRGLVLLVLVIGLVSFAILFIKKIRIL